ncbi:MAG: ABC transporter permease [Bacteroidota bacterium]|nr:ABC transporter permease [Bacteroidota bacterium]
MLKNYFKIAWRNLIKRKTFSFINIFGLAISITCCMLICAYLYHQLNYDTYPKQAKQIYRVELHLTDNGTITVFPNVDVAVGEGIKNAFPEVLASTRLAQMPAIFVRYDDKQFKEEHIATADSNFLQLFSIPFIEGDAKTALVQPNSIVITKALAKKYFDKKDALGKSLSFSGIINGLYKVTGVIDKIPDNSHFHFDAFFSTSSYVNAANNTWSNVGWFTYLLLNTNADVAKLESKFPQLVAEHVVPETQHDMGISLAQAQKSVNTFRFMLRPLTSIHLYSNTKYELEPGGDIQYVYIFCVLAFFILLLACVNFTNLATASSSKRSKEVGIRKVLGSLKKQLVFQFLAESVLIAFCSLILATLFIFLLLPLFNQISGEHIRYIFFLNPLAILSMLAFTFLVGITAGIYPAFFLSAFQTIKVLKGGTGAQLKGKSFLRNGLVVFQFAVSIILIIATIVVYQQLNFMQNKKLGYDKEQVAIINNSYLLGNNQNAFKQQLLQDSRVSAVSISQGVPGNPNMGGTQIYPQERKDNENHSEIHTNIYRIDYDYIPTLGMKIINGRNFSKDFPTDSMAVLINESAAKALGWSNTNAAGQTLVRSGQHAYNVVGVVKDFQYASAKQEIAPLIMLLGKNSGVAIVKMKTTDIKGLLADMKKEWASFNPDGPFDYSFLDENFNNLYKSEERTGQIFSVFSVIAISIASLGLLGLVAYTAERRTKEIGVRKLLGSSVQGIVFLLTKDFVKLIFISTLIAVPTAWWTMHTWLQDYANRIDISWWIFLIAVMVSLAIALITISFQAIKAALANPVKSLRSE